MQLWTLSDTMSRRRITPVLLTNKLQEGTGQAENEIKRLLVQERVQRVVVGADFGQLLVKVRSA